MIAIRMPEINALAALHIYGKYNTYVSMCIYTVVHIYVHM